MGQDRPKQDNGSLVDSNGHISGDEPLDPTEEPGEHPEIIEINKILPFTLNRGRILRRFYKITTGCLFGQ